LTQIVLERKSAASVSAATLKAKKPPGNPNFGKSPTVPEVGKSAPPIVDSVNDSRPDGTSMAAALRRLSKDRPDLHAMVKLQMQAIL